jgi:3-oxoacid CoA-transferase B subunit
LILEYLDPAKDVAVHTENGLLGMGKRARPGEEHADCIDAGGAYVTWNKGASFFDSALSFALVRGGRLDVAVLGALEVAGNGDLANWIIPGKFAPGIGGGMELAQKARRLIVTTRHTTRKGAPKILKQCTLPLTAKKCVTTIITELAVIDVVEGGLVLRELAEEADLRDVLAKTEAKISAPRAENEIPRF